MNQPGFAILLVAMAAGTTAAAIAAIRFSPRRRKIDLLCRVRQFLCDGFGRREFYTLEQVRTAVDRAGGHAGYAPLAYAAFLDPRNFERLAATQAAALDYSVLRSEARSLLNPRFPWRREVGSIPAETTDAWSGESCEMGHPTMGECFGGDAGGTHGESL